MSSSINSSSVAESFPRWECGGRLTPARPPRPNQIHLLTSKHECRDATGDGDGVRQACRGAVARVVEPRSEKRAIEQLPNDVSLENYTEVKLSEKTEDFPSSAHQMWVSLQLQN